MKAENPIVPFCIIQDNGIILNGESVFKIEKTDFSDFSKKAYHHFEMNYPKFFKMDNLSKLAFMGAELLLKKEIDPERENNIALVLSNQSSSLDTDVKYQNSISNPEEYYPSPGVFVYTLPNICLGEISIRHRLNSENSFFIFDQFNSIFITTYANLLLDSGKAEKVLCGWVEYFEEKYKGFLYMIDKKGNLDQQLAFLKTVYNQ